jgi:beta-galactosidase
MSGPLEKFRAFGVAAGMLLAPFAGAQRVTVPLDGEWQIEEGLSADSVPASFTHHVPVPGLAHSATPAFKDVDQFQSRQLLMNLAGRGLFSKAELDALGDARGISHQDRSYFWYRRSFKAPARHATAMLKVNKAQFGIAVFLNGQKLGEHFPCFSAAYFDASRAIHWGGANQLTIRVGAHPGVLPPRAFCGTDFEKNRWTPGIYDDVSLAAFDGVGITVVQAAPRIQRSALVVQTELHNYGTQPETTTLVQRVREWKTDRQVAAANSLTVTLAAGETRQVRQTLAVPNARLWSPEDPFLYRVETRTTGDSMSTRFGMREFVFDTVTQRAYLNGRPYFLRGSNIALHRFFEDPESGTLPWNGAWLNKLLGEIPKKMHWNSFRFTIGPVPQRWLDAADELGLLIQNEYMVWVGDLPVTHPEYQFYDPAGLIGEYSDWMRDNWNHPSVAIWDASNESLFPALATTVLPAVTALDLSHRPWENSYDPPADGNDPVEDHPYLWVDNARSGEWKFRMSNLEPMQGLVPVEHTMKTGHAMILNEYGWLWLNRDGSPTLLTDTLYRMLVGKDAPPDQRFAMQAYLLAGETEFWRAYRRYAAVLHFAYLTAGQPGGFTSDNFTDVKTLTLEPHFADYLGQAFKPLGVFLNFFHPTLMAGETKLFTVMMVNDAATARSGSLSLEYVDAHGATVMRSEKAFHLQALGADSYNLTITAPTAAGGYTLQAKAMPVDDPGDATLSRRWITIAP